MALHTGWKRNLIFMMLLGFALSMQAQYTYGNMYYLIYRDFTDVNEARGYATELVKIGFPQAQVIGPSTLTGEYMVSLFHSKNRNQVRSYTHFARDRGLYNTRVMELTTSDGLPNHDHYTYYRPGQYPLYPAETTETTDRSNLRTDNQTLRQGYYPPASPYYYNYPTFPAFDPSLQRVNTSNPPQTGRSYILVPPKN